MLSIISGTNDNNEEYMDNINDNNKIRSNNRRTSNKPIDRNRTVTNKKTRKKKRKKIRYNKVFLLVFIIIVICIIVNTSKKNKEIEEIEDDNSILASIEPTENSIEEQENVSNETEEKETKNENTNSEKNTKEKNTDNEEEYTVKRTGKAKYYVSVNNKENVVTVYGKDSEGKYAFPVKALICSTGRATPKSGVYKISDKYRWRALKGGVYGQYCSRIVGNILFHSVPYLSSSPDKLEYAEYDKLGTSVSAGCVRLTVQDAMWIYNNCEAGTFVEFYSSSNPGPLGKPSAQKISSNINLRNWDPTDPDSKNPWKKQNELFSNE